ncbi:TonB-dependent receptor [Aquincola sp. S2]|uniref:TonB-dependent receptor n=1 Tax=Pseudaquabacterium terrae TaxID=2732868 RepID=A0ABX2ENC1_9BURK|nr:TonB-dependent receptor [Aquabacterium terrae]NRF70113.1 TonB-dependent receptor [Aquabacterium terrae]
MVRIHFRPSAPARNPTSPATHLYEEHMKATLTPIASAVAFALIGTVAQAQQQTQQDDKKAQQVAQAPQAPAAPAAPVTAPIQLAQAQTAGPQAGTTPPPTVIEVKGIRASLESAVSVKRNATAVVDAVSAEDVGKLPDSDVGEAMGRIPGVSVGRDFGQGASVSIRGTDPQMTYTTLNGQTVASTGWYDQKAIDRSFNYSLLPPELIGGLEVYKSSQADLTEGGIGGTVIVKTRKPLDLAANTAFASLKFGKGSISDSNREGSALYSFRNDSRTFGVLIAGALEKGDYIRRGVESDMRWSGDVAPTSFVQERERRALGLTLQARPAQGVDISLNYLKLELDANNSNSSHYIFTGNSGNCAQTNAAGLCVLHTRAAGNPATDNVFLQNWVRSSSMSSDSLVLDGSFKTDGFKLSGVVGSTKADGGTNQTANFAYGQWAPLTSAPQLPLWTGTIDATGHQISVKPSSNQTIGVGNLPATSSPETWASGRGPNADKENFVQADATIDLNWGGLTAFKTGARASEHTFTRTGARGVHAATAVPGATPSLHDGTLEVVGGWSIPRPNIDAMLALASANITNWVEDRSAYGQLKEKNKALYGMVEFEKDALRGNAGLRYIRTNVSATGYNFDGTPTTDVGQNNGWSKSKVTRQTSYDDVLPSMNLVYSLNQNMMLRVAAAKAITRPNFDNMFLTTVVGFDDTNAQNDAFTYGTPDLKPQKSTQFDLSFEYYYGRGRGNLLSAAIFHKKIDNFVTTQTQLNQRVGTVSPDTGLDNWTINRYVNAGGGRINGVEVQANHAFGNGFGMTGNYTYADAKAPATSYLDELNLFTLSSRHTANLVGYFETDVYSARLAYSWRSKYMVRENGWYGNRFHDAIGSLDLSLGWNITKNLRLTFEALNLTKEDDVQYGAGNAAKQRASLQNGFPTWSFKGETTYQVGLSAKF